jgi:stage V sporulation protein B
MRFREYIKSASGGVAVLSVVGLITQIIGFAFRVALGRAIGAEAMGLYQLVLPVYSVVMSLVASGAAIAVSKLTAAYAATGDTTSIRQLLNRSTMIFLVFFAAMSALVIPGADWISVTLLRDARTYTAILLLLPCILFTGIENIHKSHFYGLKNIIPPAFSETAEQIARTMAVLGLLQFFKPAYEEQTVALVVLGMVICEIVSSSMLVVWYRASQKPNAGRNTPGVGKPFRVMGKEMFQVAAPIAAAGLITSLLGSATSVIIPQRLTASGMDAAASLSAFGVVFGMTMPLLALPFAFLSAISLNMLPRVAERAALRDTAGVCDGARQTLRVTGLILLPAAALLIPLGPSLTEALFRQEAAGRYIAPLMIGTVLTGYQAVLGSLLSGMGLQSKTAANLVLAGVLHLMLTWVLVGVPDLRLVGYVIASIASAAVGMLCCLLDLYKATGVCIHWKRDLFRPGLASVAAALAAHWVFARLHSPDEGPIVNTLICLALGTTVYWILLRITRTGGDGA